MWVSVTFMYIIPAVTVILELLSKPSRVTQVFDTPVTPLDHLATHYKAASFRHGRRYPDRALGACTCGSNDHSAKRLIFRQIRIPRLERYGIRRACQILVTDARQLVLLAIE